MLDLSLTFAAVVAVAWVLTRRVTPSDAAAAYRLWLVVPAARALWAVGAAVWAAELLFEGAQTCAVTVRRKAGCTRCRQAPIY